VFVLVVDPDPAAGGPAATLDAAGAHCRVLAPAELAGWAGPAPDVVLLSASLGPHRVAELLSELTAGPAARRPAALVFPADDRPGDDAALDACAQAGFDVLTPPYRPALVRARLAAALAGRGHGPEAQERELRAAGSIQAGFLPDGGLIPAGWQVETRFRPARHVAGDFYDVFDLVGGRMLGLVVADVCDKGVGAALFMALARSLLRYTADRAGSGGPLAAGAVLPSGGALTPSLGLGAGPLVESVLSTNRYLVRQHAEQGYFVTVFFAVLDPASGALLYVNAGHNPPIVLHADGRQTVLGPTGPALGLGVHSSYHLGHVTLGAGDTAFLYTDGVLDARSPGGEPFGADRLRAVLAERPAGSAGAALNAVDRALARHVGGAEQFDDITMLVLHRPR
jgi:serine phosphatase RsbU (regulator of sigma subunit)